jgi:hypothetical protein
LSSPHYLGLKFVINGKTHYGWARFKPHQGLNNYYLTGYAYETIPNKPITTGQIKGPDDNSIDEPIAFQGAPASQPASLGMLALGFVRPHTSR